MLEFTQPWAFGLLLYTVFVRISIPVMSGELTFDREYDFHSAAAAKNAVG